MADPQDRSTPALMADLLDQVTQLVRKAVQLFRAEVDVLLLEQVRDLRGDKPASRRRVQEHE